MTSSKIIPRLTSQNVFNAISLLLICFFVFLAGKCSNSRDLSFKKQDEKYIKVGDMVVACNYKKSSDKTSSKNRFVSPNGSPPKGQPVRVIEITRSGGLRIENYPTYLNNKLASYCSSVFKKVEDYKP